MDSVFSEKMTDQNGTCCNSTKESYALEVYDSIKEIDLKYDIEDNKLILSSISYLKFLEENPPSGLSQHYAVVKEGKDVLAYFYFQVVPFRLNEHLKYNKTKESFWKTLKKNLKKFISQFVNRKILIAGNMLHSGNYGVVWTKDMSDACKKDIWTKAINTSWSKLEQKYGKISILMAKDFMPDNLIATDVFESNNCALYNFQPAMLLTIREEWNTMEDYLSAISSKYRVRYRRARKKMKGIEKRVLSISDLETYKEDVFKLYKKVADEVEFNLAYLHEDYYYNLKLNFPKECTIFGYFKEGQLVGFVPVLDNDGTLEGLFLGFENDANYKYHLYHNFLFDILEEAIARKCKKIDYARTALEIKSTLGAEPQMLNCYLKHKKKPVNSVVHRFINYFTPKYEWTQRKPFKEN